MPEASLRVHLTLAGQWTTCQDNACELPFHVADTTAAQMQATSLDLLLPIFEAAQPYNFYNHQRAAKVWTDAYGEPHRDFDLPAGIFNDGALEWYRHGKHHRKNDRPAFIDSDGSMEWYWDGLLHRENDLPAIIWSNGTMEWYQNGQLHREHAPAVVQRDESLGANTRPVESWYWHGQLHRIGGPAAYTFEGEPRFYLHGQLVTEREGMRGY